MIHAENDFCAGFSRVNITPPLGISLGGHPKPETRLATEVLDDLEINTVAVSAGGKTAVLFSADLLYIRKIDSEKIRRKVADENNIPYESIFIACTHTHTGPLVSADHIPGFVGNRKRDIYREFLPTRFSDAAKAALADLKPARMGYAVGEVHGISFIRRYRMKDGTVRTNPGQGNPDIVAPIGEADPRVNVLRIVRQGGKEIAVANFGVHPDTLKGFTKISADYPRTVRETVEAAMPVHCIFFNGAQGDINHLNVNARPKVLDAFMRANDVVDKDYNFTQYINTRHIGRAIAGTLLQVYGDVQWVDVDTVAYGNMDCVVPTNKATPEEMVWAREISKKYRAGEPIEGPPHTATKAERMMRLEDGPDEDALPVSAIRIGPAVFVGLPGEPFNGIGVGLKENSPFTVTLPCCLVNGGQGYFPMYACYEEGGYEAGSSNFKAGVAERLIETGTALMHALKQQ
jgi:hypothetical protein